MYTYVATALIAASLAATGAWKVQTWRFDAKEKERAEQQLESERMAAKAALRNAENVVTAQNEAQSRLRRLRLDADGSRAALIGLSSSADQALRDAAVSHDACTVRAAAISKLLNQCGGAYQELGAVADRHASDLKTLMDAWPK